LSEKGIEVLLGAEVVSLCPPLSLPEGRGRLVIADGRVLECDEAIWCTQARGHSWLRECPGLLCDQDGCIIVSSTLQSVSMPNVFAAGDICSNRDHPRPKAGVFAVRAGPPLYSNICKFLLQQELLEWVPQSEFLGIIGTGNEYAIASKGGLGIEGHYLWKLKDQIDRTWMAGYKIFPSMEDMIAKNLREGTSPHEKNSHNFPILAESMGTDTIALLTKTQMRCGGCGSKVGAQVLSRALERIRNLIVHDRPEVISGIGMSKCDDAAIIRAPEDPLQLVQSIDYFRSFISDPFLFGQIAANHGYYFL
jgi:selenide,water dikinase